MGKVVFSKDGAFDKPFPVVNLLDQIPLDKIVNIVLTTRGGAATSCEKILKNLKKRPLGYNAYIRQECYSAGAIIALGAREIL